MTQDEFQDKYAEYMTRDAAAARDEAKRVNAEGIEGNCAVAVKFGEQWCLMLGTAALHIAAIGIKPDGVA